MSHLSDFPSPLNSTSTKCEINSKLIGETNIVILDYRNISLKDGLAQKKSVACCQSSCTEVFKTTEETFLDKLSQQWNTSGVAGIVNELAHIERIPTHLQRLLVKLHSWIKILDKWNQSVFPKKVISDVPCKKTLMACHPHIGRIAITIKDITVKVLNLNQIAENQEVFLRDKRITKINCLAWRPKSSMSIAAGCSNGIMVWLLDPSTVSSIKPGSHMARFLTSSDMNQEVSSVSWCSDGILLACSCKNSPSIWIWNILLQSSTPVHRVGAEIASVSWSPCKKRLLAASSSSTFRIWNTRTWSSDKWENLNGKVTSACWSSCGSYLLFSVADEPVIFYTHFSDNNIEMIDIGGSGSALKCADVSAVPFSDGDNELIIGGLISSMTWDPTDSRLAVTFHNDNGSNQPNIALYHIRKQPNLQLIPCGFIKGEDDVAPLAIDFINGYDKGALLSVYWSSEEVSLIPLLFDHSLSPLVKVLGIRDLDTTGLPVIEDIGEISTTANNTTLYSAE